MRRAIHFLAAFTLVALLLAGSLPVPATAASAYGTLRVSVSEPETLDPHLASYASEVMILNQVYESLVRLDDNLELRPALAASWTVSADSSVFTFTLASARFANGRAVVASDVVYSLMRALSPTLRDGQPGYMAAYLYDIKGAEAYNKGDVSVTVGITAVDPATVRITLARPVPAGVFLKKLATWVGAVVAREEVEAGGAEWWRDPARRAGTGPFVLARWDAGESIRLIRNPYHDRSNVLLQGIVFRSLNATADALAEYRAGRLDVSPADGSIASELADPILKAQLRTGAGTCYFYFALRNQKAPFTGPAGMKLRQAINHGVNKAEFVTNLMSGFGVPAKGVIPPSIYGYNPNLQALDFNLTLAKQRLQESGYTGTPPLVIYSSSATFARARARWLRDALQANLGITATLTDDSGSNYQIAAYGWCADYPDPENFLPPLLRTGASMNRTGYSNPAFDALVDQAGGEFDETTRIGLYRQAEQLAISDAAELPLYYNEFAALIKPHVLGPMAQRWQRGAAFTDISLDLRAGFLPTLLR